MKLFTHEKDSPSALRWNIHQLTAALVALLLGTAIGGNGARLRSSRFARSARESRGGYSRMVLIKTACWYSWGQSCRCSAVELIGTAVTAARYGPDIKVS
jgi:hypothetical protein